MISRKALKEKYKFALAFIVTGLAILTSIFFINGSANNTYKLQEVTDDSTIELLHVNSGQILTLETAATPSKRQQGLMYRKSLKPNAGMFFIFSQEAIQSFWMKNTSIPLDIIFLDKNLKVVSVHSNTKVNQTSEIYDSKSPSMFVVETIAGWANSSNLQEGDYFEVKSIK